MSVPTKLSSSQLKTQGLKKEQASAALASEDQQAVINAGRVNAVVITGRTIKTENFAEASGAVSAGAVLDGTRTDDTVPAVRTSPAGIQIGATVLKNAWFAQVRVFTASIGYNVGGSLVSFAKSPGVVVGTSATANAVDIDYGVSDLGLTALVFTNTESGAHRLVKIAETTSLVTLQMQGTTGAAIATPWPFSFIAEVIIVLVNTGTSGAWM